MKHCMIDIETLGHLPNAACVQIGAVVFTKDEILAKFEGTISFADAIALGAATGSTLAWWFTQGDAARKSVLDGRDAKEVYQAFADFILEHQPDAFWAHATFDFPILRTAYAKIGIAYPINFRTSYDLRTAELFQPGLEWPPREGTAHTALADAMYQARGLQVMMKAQEKQADKAWRYDEASK